jgi:hypothetical protein
MKATISMSIVVPFETEGLKLFRYTPKSLTAEFREHMRKQAELFLGGALAGPAQTTIVVYGGVDE